jgi:hypothetical protein
LISINRSSGDGSRLIPCRSSDFEAPINGRCVSAKRHRARLLIQIKSVIESNDKLACMD